VIDSEFKRKGIAEVNLTVFDFNEEAVAFYKKLGYVNKHITMTTSLNTNDDA
jgi:ribosomal protein S18 acetylase RimI-like enzyme